MYVDPNEPFRAITKELLGVLRERYPDGLSAVVGGDPIKLKIPAEEEQDEFVIDYGLPTHPHDWSQTWTDLDVGDGCKNIASFPDLKDGATVAFFIRRADEPKTDFVVEAASTMLEDDEADDTIMANS